MTVDTLRLSAEQANELLAKGEASSDELYRAYLDAIGERDPELHAFLHTGFWECKDPYNDAVQLNDLSAAGEAPWKLWG